MYAAVPFYNLPKLRKAIEEDLPKAPRGLIRTWREIHDTVKRQKVKPGYFQVLEFSGAARAAKTV